ncbi:hypothetical protein MTR_1g045050 [Medicago truncatula]|uniref:Uncharacterized protein n=1 Tax=Medicago truncatula TaxID=3880 RepID=G7I6L5_MEDTR|nr:hypothetical protein MTR_1g045050 [Medicago truncatula]
MDLFTRDKISYNDNELSNYWSSSKFLEKSVSNFNFDRLYLFPEHEQVKIYSEEKEKDDVEGFGIGLDSIGFMCMIW